ncbi:GNAT family N-acetyltransferase [Christiangramia crocea]|uniref:GNAT family N-acetyltransferase n=1 Tax=Christiangramia crocea TaxID=2904124 RepID=A0A9X1UUL1_9FLAO|nr:GNAT family N-acetyltransferase [Gramella crocea]MCG9970617.1 GNAT family N-acetyltransferase [Gramella crocea]
MKERYIFKSARLGFRNWQETDLDKLYKINSDKRVMEFFPSIVSREDTKHFISRMKEMLTAHGFCYFAVEKLNTGEFVGFTGLAEQNYESVVTPCIDIGWRLDAEYWGQGFATEGAKACLDYGFKDLDIEKIRSIAPVINKRSIQVMKKIGMEKHTDFDNPFLKDHKSLERCVCYEIRNIKKT